MFPKPCAWHSIADLFRTQDQDLVSISFTLACNPGPMILLRTTDQEPCDGLLFAVLDPESVYKPWPLTVTLFDARLLLISKPVTGTPKLSILEPWTSDLGLEISDPGSVPLVAAPRSFLFRDVVSAKEKNQKKI